MWGANKLTLDRRSVNGPGSGRLTAPAVGLRFRYASALFMAQASPGRRRAAGGRDPDFHAAGGRQSRCGDQVGARRGHRHRPRRRWDGGHWVFGDAHARARRDLLSSDPGAWRAPRRRPACVRGASTTLRPKRAQLALPLAFAWCALCGRAEAHQASIVYSRIETAGRELSWTFQIADTELGPALGLGERAPTRAEAD